MDWKTLNSFVSRWRESGVGNDESQLKRKPEVAVAYEKRKQELASANRTLEQEILHKYFSGPDAGRSVVITENEFPYHLQDGIEHLVVWGNPDLLDEEDFRRFGPSSLYHQYPDHDITWFINPAGWRSINGVPHAHAFIRALPPKPEPSPNYFSLVNPHRVEYDNPHRVEPSSTPYELLSCTCDVYYYGFALYPEGCQPVQTHCLGCGKIYKRFL
jgi:hypothetical protein